VLVAAPKTLGDLRELLPDPVKSRVVAEIDKDLTRVPLRDLPKHLETVLKL
jgi:protein required for attachment to host cells